MPDGRITCRLLITVALLGLTGCFGSSTGVVWAPRVWFVAPANGDYVTSPFTVTFGVQSLAVIPKCDVEPCTIIPGAGHHHVIIDSDPIPFNMKIPTDANHVHFGDGGASKEITLPPGEHTLIAQFADSRHVVCCAFSQTIKVTVVTPTMMARRRLKR